MPKVDATALAESEEDGEYDEETLAAIGEALKASDAAKKSGDWNEAARQFCYAAELERTK